MSAGGRARSIARGLALILFLLLSAQAWAQAAPSPAYKARAEALVGLFNGKTAPEALFSATFLNAVPAAQVKALSKQLGSQLGAARRVAKIEAKSPTTGTVFIDFERGTLQLAVTIGAATPHRIEGLFITGTEAKGDSFAALLTEVKALPGRASLAAARLGDGGPARIAAQESAAPLAIGSTFKLFLLAELSRSIQAGERKWSDVVPLDRRSLPSGFLQDWPPGAPMTLYGLAGLMISQSDNSATDTLLHLLGRERVEQLLPALGVAAPERNRPFLSTLEAFALKAKGGSGWSGTDEAGRRAMLAALSDATPEAVDAGKLAGAPNAIDSIEWFASAEDLIRTMDWLRRNGGKEALDILAINPGIGKAAAERFGYLGYKGGSEVGVISMTFLVRTKAGQWYAVSGSWNDPKAPIDEPRFAALMSRAVALLR